MKRRIVPALAAGIPFGFLLGVAYSLDASVSTSIVAGILGGVAAAIAVAAYVAWREKRCDAWAAKVSAPYDAEGIVHRGYAVLGSNALAFGAIAAGLGGALLDRGGLLVLTTQRLVFIPHKHNLFGKQAELPVSNIAGVQHGYALFWRNTITIATTTKQSVQLGVRGRREWIAKLPGVKQAV